MTLVTDPTANPRPVGLRSSEEWEKPSPVDGYRYRILVAHPEGEPPPAGFPTLYVLDGDAIFATVVEAVRMRARRPDVTRVAPTVVVGIAHPVDQPFDRGRRRFDYTPGPQEGVEVTEDTRAEVGGSGHFLDLLEQVVMPAISRRFDVDPARRSVFGHSLAGLLTIHAMGRRGLFGAHGAASPSIWWNKKLLTGLVEQLRTASTDGTTPPRAMITVGEYEERLAEWELPDAAAPEKQRRRKARRMVGGAEDLANALTGAGIPAIFERFPREDHASSLLLSINRFLPFALSP